MFTLIFFLALSCANFSCYLHAQTFVQGIDSITPYQIIKDKSIKIKKIDFTGNQESIGWFSDSLARYGFSEAIILSTGRTDIALGQNSRPNSGANFGDYFFTHPQLNKTKKYCDGSMLRIQFVPTLDSISFSFVFASEEYPEFINKDYGDTILILLKE